MTVVPVIQKLVITWTGVPSGGGASIMFAADAAVLSTAMRTFFDSIKVYLAPGVGITFPTGGYTIHADTGIASTTWSQTPPSPVGSINTGGYAAPAGAVVTWRTPELNFFGHLMKGRTFIVPLGQSAFQNNGTLDDTFKGILQTKAADVVTTGAPVVYERHSDGPDADHPDRVAHDGKAALVTSATVNDRAAVLRSRRN